MSVIELEQRLLGTGFFAVAHERWRNFKRRGRVMAMAELDDNMLYDIGVTRDEIEYASGLPLSQNPVDALYRTALERRRRSSM